MTGTFVSTASEFELAIVADKAIMVAMFFVNGDFVRFIISRQHYQWTTLFENKLTIRTPTTMNAIPTRAGKSSGWLSQIAATIVTNTIPAPDQTAYTTPTGINFTSSLSSRKEVV